MEQYQRVYAAVDLSAILDNMKRMQENLYPGTMMLGVIKADGYGHGAVPIGRQLESLPYVYGYAVATAEEAFALRQAGLQKPILVLGYTFPYCYEDLIRQKIRPTVFREDQVWELSDVAERLGAKVSVHVKVDTGMSRIGVRADEKGLALFQSLAGLPHVRVEGIYTHFARADEKDQTVTKEQLLEFTRFVEAAQCTLEKEIPLKHCSNSAAILTLREANLSLVRAGIALYGLSPSEAVPKELLSLRPALSLKSHLVYVKEVEAGTPISYGGTFVTKERTRIATVPVGYGDGYPRSLSGKGYVLIRGKRAPILGRVCMDQFMVDVTAIPEALEGDEVTLIGKDGAEEITMEALGALSGRFNYEFACNLGKRIPRIYIKDGKVYTTEKER
ncbi:MAG: alanine racemase [bacterium]|nr:alanine racemase [bacterium]MCM1424137.1 alanine racemase [bacterium]